MKLLLINTHCGIFSTGRICAAIAHEYEDKGWEVRIAYGRDPFVPEDCRRWAVRIGTRLEVALHALLSRIFDHHAFGFCSYWGTKKFIRWADEWNPDCVWLHNIHGYYLNVGLLFEWLKSKPGIDVKWTLHSCWAFTGHCTHFTYAKCNKWEYCCDGCIQKHEYPAAVFMSRARRNYYEKKRAFSGLRQMTLITPSQWLADLTRRSFLKEYPVRVVRNKVDRSMFRRTASAFKEDYGITGKVMILGVATTWNDRKGLREFLELSRILDDRYQIVLVGLTMSQMRKIPKSILGIERTKSVNDLVRIYNAADWFFNPTHEDTFPTVNLEAVACECKIVTYDTGGCRETVEGYDRAMVLSGDKKNVPGFLEAIGFTRN